MPEPSSAPLTKKEKKTKKKLTKTEKKSGKMGTTEESATTPAPPGPPPDPLHMDGFFHLVEEIKTNLDTIENNCAAVDKAHQVIASSTLEMEIKEQEAIISRYIASTNGLSTSVKAQLERMAEETERLAPDAPSGSGDLRMRKINHAALLQKFTTLMRRLQGIQQQASSKHQAQVERQYKISTASSLLND